MELQHFSKMILGKNRVFLPSNLLKTHALLVCQSIASNKKLCFFCFLASPVVALWPALLSTRGPFW